MPAKTKTAHVRPIRAASFDLEGRSVVLNPNEIFDADHEYVRAHPTLFKDVEPTRARPAVEVATAEPGEARG